MSVLVHRDIIEVYLACDLEPTRYYCNGFCFHVWGGFEKGNVVRQARQLPAGTKFRLNVWENTKDGASYEEIEAALGENDRFDETTICGVFAALLAGQPNGQRGHLNLRRDNLACLGDCFANVYWTVKDGDAYWVVTTEMRGECRYKSGGQVFSLAN